MSEFKDCPRCGRNHRHIKYCGWYVGKLMDHADNLEHQLAEAREENENLRKLIHEWTDLTILDVENGLEQLKEKGDG